MPVRLNNLLEKKPHSNASSITVQLLKKLDVPVTAATVVDNIEQHPDYPSLYSISDSLSKWKVENLALKVKAKTIEELPVPFIAHSKKGSKNLQGTDNRSNFIEIILNPMSVNGLFANKVKEPGT